MLAPDGELGRIWTLTRPLTYRAIDGLVDKGLITRTGQAAGRGRDRVILAATPAGRRLAKKWLDTPVEHLRDVRTELLVKLFLRDRAGLDNEDLLAAQQQLFAPTIDALTSTSADDDLVDLWRRESARAVRRFLDEALHPPGQHDAGQAGAAAQRPQPAPRHGDRRPPRRGHVHRQSRARRRSTADRGDHQGRRRRPRPRPRRRRRRHHQVDRGDRRQGLRRRPRIDGSDDDACSPAANGFVPIREAR